MIANHCMERNSLPYVLFVHAFLTLIWTHNIIVHFTLETLFFEGKLNCVRGSFHPLDDACVTVIL